MSWYEEFHDILHKEYQGDLNLPRDNIIFLMQVTAIELEGMEGQESIMYDITLCEIWVTIMFHIM